MRRHVRAQPPRVLPAAPVRVREFRNGGETVRMQSRIKGEAEGFVGARSLGKVHRGTHSFTLFLRVLRRIEPAGKTSCFFAALHLLHLDAHLHKFALEEK